MVDLATLCFLSVVFFTAFYWSMPNIIMSFFLQMSYRIGVYNPAALPENNKRFLYFTLLYFTLLYIKYQVTELRIVVSVTDVNDHSPSCPQGQYIIKIGEVS